MFAGLEGLEGLWIVQEWRGGDVNEIDFGPRQQRVHVFDIWDAKALRGRKRRLPMRAGHGRQFHAGDLRQVLQSEEAEASRSDYSNANRPRFH